MASLTETQTELAKLIPHGIKDAPIIDPTGAKLMERLPLGQLLATVTRCVKRSLGNSPDPNLVICLALCDEYSLNHHNTTVPEKDILQAWRVLQLVEGTSHPFQVEYRDIIRGRCADGYRRTHSPRVEEKMRSSGSEDVCRVTSSPSDDTIPALDSPRLTVAYLGFISAATLLHRDLDDPMVARYCANKALASRGIATPRHRHRGTAGPGGVSSIL